MRFRTLLFIGFGLAALIPAAVLTAVQLREVDRRIDRSDEALVRTAAGVRTNIANRLKTARQLVRITSLTAAESLRGGTPSEEVRGTLAAALKTMVETTPLLLNAHIDGADLRSVVFFPERNEHGQTNVGQDHSGRLHARALNAPAGEILTSSVFRAVGAFEGPTVNLSMPVFDADTERRLGVVSAALNLSAVVDELTPGLDQGTQVAVFDASAVRVFPRRATPFDGVELSCGATHDVCRHAFNDRAWFYAVEKLPENLGSWSIVVYTDARPILSERLAVWQTAAATLFLVLALCAVLVLFLTHHLGQAVEKLTRHAQSGKPVPDAQDRVVFPKELAVVQLSLQQTALQLKQKHEALKKLNLALEQKVRQRTHSLQQRTRLLQALFDSMAEAVFLFDEKAVCRRTNRRADTLLTRPQADQLYRQACERAARGKTEIVRMFSRTFEVVCFELPYADREGVVGMLVRDVTDREALDAMKQTLLSMAAHELKTPVHAMRLQIDSLRRQADARMPAEQRMLLSDLDESARHLQDLVRDWLDVARIDAGAFEIECRPVSLDAVIRQAVARTAARWPQQQVTIRIDEDAEGIMGDETRLRQLFYNLLSNSARYARSGVPSRVLIECRILQAARPSVRIRVSDNGVGVAAEHAQRIFDRFYQIETGNRRRAGGTGLGLVIVKAIVQAHGGSIRLAENDEAGRSEYSGAVFDIEIPCYPADCTF